MSEHKLPVVSRRAALGMLGVAGAAVGLSQVVKADPAGATTLQDLIDAAPSGGAVELTAGGAYSISSTLTISKPLRLFSAGGATITKTGSTAAIAVTSDDVGFSGINLVCAGSGIVAGQTTIRYHHMTMTDVTITGPGSGTAGTIGLDLYAISNSIYRNVNISAFEKGVRILSDADENNGSLYVTFVGGSAQSCVRGYSVEAYHCNDIRFLGCVAYGCSSRGISIEDGNHITMQACTLSSCGTGAYIETLVDPGYAPYNGIVNCSFSSNTSDWQIIHSGTRYVGSSTIINPAVVGTYHYTDNGQDTVSFIEGHSAVSASTPGSVVSKLKVHDAQGYTLGYLPVFDAIS